MEIELDGCKLLRGIKWISTAVESEREAIEVLQYLAERKINLI